MAAFVFQCSNGRDKVYLRLQVGNSLTRIGTHVDAFRASESFQRLVLGNLPFILPDLTVLLVIPINSILAVMQPAAILSANPLTVFIQHMGWLCSWVTIARFRPSRA